MNLETDTVARTLGVDVGYTSTFRTRLTAPPFVPQLQSLRFGGVSFLELAPVSPDLYGATRGFTNVFSFATWAKFEAVSNPNGAPLHGWAGGSFGSNPGGLSWLEIETGSLNNVLVTVQDDIGVGRQQHRYSGVAGGGGPSGPWRHYVFTWDGTQGGARFYVDGVLTAPTNILADSAAGTFSADRTFKGRLGSMITGARFTGLVYSSAAWGVDLGASEVAAIYNGGNARDYDLNRDAGAYISSDFLIDYYRTGLTGTTGAEFGIDYGNDGVPRNFGSVGTPFTESDLVSDIPEP